eukprot:3138598-Pyramimonas_sp.AAC.1
MPDLSLVSASEGPGQASGPAEDGPDPGDGDAVSACVADAQQRREAAVADMQAELGPSAVTVKQWRSVLACL